MGGVGVSVVGAGGVEVADGAAVRHDDVPIAPVVAQDAVQQAVAAAAGAALETVVGAHHLLDVGLLHQSLEGRQIGLVQVARVDAGGVERVAVPLGPRMDGEMLGAGV